MKKRILATLLVAVMVASCFVGCGGNKTASGERELTVWGLASKGDMPNSPFAKDLAAKTGIKFNFMQAMADAEEPFNLMIASGDYPDVMWERISGRPGGERKFFEDGVIISLTDLVEKKMPNYWKRLNEDPLYMKNVRTDDGEIFNVMQTGYIDFTSSTIGPIARVDLLEKEGFAIPETLDEWETILRHFKNKGMKAPLSYNLQSMETNFGMITGAYNVKTDLEVRDGKVEWGYAVADRMVPALKKLNSWYKEGLLDKEIVKVTSLDANILNSETVITAGYLGSSLGKWINAIKGINPEAKFSAIPFPKLNKGDKLIYGSDSLRYGGNGGYITTSCDNIDLACEFLDWGFTEEGHLFYNFGTEGVTYEMIDGYPTYTDLIKNNPDGKSISEISPDYMRGPNGSGPFILDRRVYEQYYEHPEQMEAHKYWSMPENTANLLPSTLTFTAEETERMSPVLAAINTYSDEMLFRYIMGLESFDTYPKFVEKLYEMGLQTMIDVYQAAYDRFQNR